MRSPFKAVALASAFCIFISTASLAQDREALNPELVSELYQETKFIERRAARLAVNWREEVKLQLIRSRNRLGETSQNWLEGDDFTGAQFQAQFEEALLVAQSMGLDPDRMRRYLDLLKLVIRRADLREFEVTYAEDVPATSVDAAISWLELNTEAEAEASAQRQAFRAALYKRTTLLFLDALLEEEAMAALTKLRRLEQAIKEIQGADVERLIAETQALVAKQTLIADVAAGFPVVGETLDFLALTSGESPSGEVLDTWGKALALLGLIPVAGDLIQVVRRSPVSREVMAKLVVGIESASSLNLEVLASATGGSVEQLQQMTNRLKGIPEVASDARRLGGRSFADRSNQAIVNSLNDLDVRAADKLWSSVQNDAKQRVSELRAVLTESEDILDQKVLNGYVSVRKQNLAVKTLQKADYATRVKVSSIEEKLFGTLVREETGAVVNAGNGLVDQAAFKAIKTELEPALALAVKSDNLVKEIGRVQREIGSKSEDEFASAAAFMEKNAELSLLEADLSAVRASLEKAPAGPAAQKIIRTAKRRKLAEGKTFYVADTVPTEDLTLEVFNATNDIPALGKIGTDRDATFRLVDADGVRLDIPADFAGKHYAISLYEALHPGQRIDRANVSDVEKALTFASQMDHAITDAVDAEAYKLYDADLDDILGSDARQNPTALTAVDAESLQRTFEFKGFHLLKAIPNNPRQTLINRVEAMRQIQKQFDNLVLPRITAGGSSLDAVLPPKTLVVYRLFQRVESEDITPAQAEVGLSAIGLTLEQSFVLMADGINQVVRASR